MNGRKYQGDKRPNSRTRRLYRERLLQAQDGLCAWCKAPIDYEDAELDRIVPGAEGGTYALVNLVAACFDCNRQHGADVRHGRAEGRIPA